MAAGALCVVPSKQARAGSVGAPVDPSKKLCRKFFTSLFAHHPFCTVDVVSLVHSPSWVRCAQVCVQAMALRSLATREEILADLSAAGEPFTPQVIERYRLAAGVAGGFACVCMCVCVVSECRASFSLRKGGLLDVATAGCGAVWLKDAKKDSCSALP
jgi:hypothetical protein